MGNDNALKTSVFQEWYAVVVETSKKSEMQEQLNQKSMQLDGFKNRNKKSATSVNQRASQLLDLSNAVFFFSFWKREVKVEIMRRFGKEKNMKRKQELMGVKGLFKEFATSLDASLKDGTPPVSP